MGKRDLAKAAKEARDWCNWQDNGDFNAGVGKMKKKQEIVVATYTFGDRNIRGETPHLQESHLPLPPSPETPLPENIHIKYTENQRLT